MDPEKIKKVKTNSNFSEYGTLVKITGEEVMSFSYSSLDKVYREIRIYSAIAYKNIF